jgi:transposase-like protein
MNRPQRCGPLMAPFLAARLGLDASRLSNWRTQAIREAQAARATSTAAATARTITGRPLERAAR